jgi:hypothetical protein
MKVEYVFNQQQMQEIVNHLKQLPFGDVNEIMSEIKRQDEEISSKIKEEFDAKSAETEVVGYVPPITKEVQ